ncbi:MAG: 5'/3'-nucleotidase SurE [Candidatus Caldatribacterium sp.]|uniref:5'/3'-nucleotidase SurE n=1 Tax=Candidatus Caldatribacterium sp. TaxID=2282143 RepID=UPI00299681E2|nr:5'/3'-nucleotidase SurE [Candidatus Caldatribacterium sp.]MCX7730756.1 5'/3'-nucleotidase SurE [Candidatus Caldatribacterium sp.]MDW8081178.1 5'/3'-nucleotidase SurE [Candidatus Calescibacterium sp.]
MTRVLITNDDGFESPGIRALVRAFQKEAEVILVAPKDERSCSSHSITARHPLRVYEVEVEGVRGYAVDGTPADTVILGLNLFRNIDFVVSGINRGPNLGFDVFYSGTVAAGLEAAMSGIPSLAVSLVLGNHANYELAASVALEVWKLFGDILRGERNLVLNVNVPDVASREALRGLSITELGDRFYFTGVREVERGATERVFVFEEIERDPLFLENSDFQAVWENKVSVTPLRPNLTDYLVRRRLVELLKG